MAAFNRIQAVNNLNNGPAQPEDVDTAIDELIDDDGKPDEGPQQRPPNGLASMADHTIAETTVETIHHHVDQPTPELVPDRVD